MTYDDLIKLLTLCNHSTAPEKILPKSSKPSYSYSFDTIHIYCITTGKRSHNEMAHRPRSDRASPLIIGGGASANCNLHFRGYATSKM